MRSLVKLAVSAFAILLVCTTTLAQKAPEFPTLRYGDPNAKVKVLAFMSPSCVDCQKTFKGIVQGPLAADYIAKGKVILSIMPYPISDNDFQFQSRLTCSEAGYAKAFEWHMINGYSNQRQWTIDKGNAAGLGIPESEKCLHGTAIDQILLSVKAHADQNWQVKRVPFFVVGKTATLSEPNWAQLKEAIDKDGGF